MKNKRLIITLGCAVILVLGTAAATLAYFTDTDSAVNTFTVGQVGITLDEADVNEAGEVISEKRVTENDYHLIPGHSYVKDPTVHIDADSESCYVYVEVTNGLEAILDAPTVESQIEKNDWQPLEGVSNIYYREYIASEPKPTEAVDMIVFESFKVRGDGVTNTVIADCSDAEIKVTAYAIQKSGFETAAEAWETAKHQFGL